MIKKHQYLELLEDMYYPVLPNLLRNLEKINFYTQIIEQVVKYNKEQEIILWVRGSSGTAIAAVITQILGSKGYEGVSSILVRKPLEDSHSGTNYVYRVNPIHFIVDDFIATGNTLNAILEEMPLPTTVHIITTGTIYEVICSRLKKDYKKTKFILHSGRF